MLGTKCILLLVCVSDDVRLSNQSKANLSIADTDGLCKSLAPNASAPSFSNTSGIICSESPAPWCPEVSAIFFNQTYQPACDGKFWEPPPPAPYAPFDSGIKVVNITSSKPSGASGKSGVSFWSVVLGVLGLVVLF